LATNKHVVEATAPRGTKVIPAKHVSVRLNLPNGAYIGHDVPLRAANNQVRWKHHDNPDVDLALLPFDMPAQPETCVRFWTVADTLPQDAVLDLAEPVNSAGYPRGFFDKTNNRPVMRHGSIATEFGVKFMGKLYFLNDTVHFEGNSGSPVITRAKTQLHRKNHDPLTFDQPQCLLAGIHSKREYVMGQKNTDEYRLVDLGLGVSWYAYLLDEIAQKF
jgi:hypothetical protein